ncbi:MAG: hypothetical protein GTN81_17865 [Proteobacteria bacterium]|nr:hypothetical protein [Pseudomonadota bacterium]
MEGFLQYLGSSLELAWQDVIDILFMTVVAYKLYTWFQGTRAFKAFLGLMALGIFYLVARTFGLFLTTRVFQILWQVFVILLIVLFQSEIREVLEKVNPIKFFPGKPSQSGTRTMEEIVGAAFELAKENLGALIVLERHDRVDRLMKEGVRLDGEISREILASIFQKRSPAHDGAAIIRGGRLSVVGSYLPLTEREGLPQHFGTRHRAAIGLTERCDALGVVVSEENRSVSLAQSGRIEPFPNPAGLKETLEREMGAEVRNQRSFLVYVRAWVTHYWKTKMIAFGIVVLAWILFVGRQPLDVGLTAPLKYRNVPTGMGIKAGALEEVFIRVEGPRNEIRNLNSRDISVFVDLSDSQIGDNLVQISKGSVETPFGTRISLIRPSRITVTLERVE